MNQIHAHAPVDVKVVIVANKIDLEKERKITTEEGMQAASKYGLPFFECSAKSGMNVQEIFQKIGSDILEKIGKNRLDTMESQANSNNLDNVKSKTGIKKCC